MAWLRARTAELLSSARVFLDGLQMTTRGGGNPRLSMVFEPRFSMGPPLRSFAADAHDCIMVQVETGPTAYKFVARCSRLIASSPPIVSPANAAPASEPPR